MSEKTDDALRHVTVAPYLVGKFLVAYVALGIRLHPDPVHEHSVLLRGEGSSGLLDGSRGPDGAPCGSGRAADAVPGDVSQLAALDRLGDVLPGHRVCRCILPGMVGDDDIGQLFQLDLAPSICLRPCQRRSRCG
jgi:hypothetical protein